MTMESSVCSQEVSLSFVIPAGLTEDKCAPSLICAYQACIQSELNPIWRTAEECLNLKPVKQDVFVCEPFEGDAFNYLKSDNFKCVVLGPRCLLSCLHRKIPIPELPSPIHNVSMHKLVITLTGFEKEEKEELRTIITRSSGIYANNFSEAVTHLVANTVGSKKYIVAIEKEIPVMTGEWLKAVWRSVEKDYREDIYATDDQFLSHTCPVFKNMVICISQMPRNNKKGLMKIIEENGGIYSATLEMSVTTVLIVPSAEGEKFEYARNWRIQCLTPDWIYDSVEIGHALNMDGYVVKSRGASTPTDENVSNNLPDVSHCSTIMNETELGRGITHVNETLHQSTLGDISIMRKNSITDEHVNKGLQAVEELDLQQAMKAGSFLDGCKVFLSGFTGTQLEKLRRILNAGGATRFSQLTESVTHVIIGKVNEEHLNTIMSWTSKPHVVYGDWISESISLKKPADEAGFSYKLQGESSSPKKSRKSSSRKLSIDDNETFVDEALLNQYLKPTSGETRKSTSPDDDSMNMSALPDSQDSSVQGIFYGKFVTISGYDQKITEDYITAIREQSGEVVSLDYKGHVHFSIVNIDGSGKAHHRAVEVVSHYFLQDCFDLDKWEEPKMIDVEYYHLPLYYTKDLKPLEGCVFAISSYVGLERQFLVSLATTLGAEFQESFAKKSNPTKKVKASTHLICPTANGDKYKAALKWKVPAVTHDWLLGCLRSGERESEPLYALSNSNRPTLNGKDIIQNLLKSKIDDTDLDETIIYESVMDGDGDEVAPTPMNNKVRSLREKETFLSPQEVKTPDMETIRKLHPTPGVSRGDQSIDEMPTPETPYGSTWHPNPSARTRKYYKRLLDTFPDEPPMKKRGDPSTPISVYHKRFIDKVAEDHKNFRVRTPVWFNKSESKTDVKSLGKEKLDFDDKENEGSDSSQLPKNQQPLSGVVVCSAYKHQDQQKQLYEAVTNLGGECRWTLDDSVTHFIFQGQNNDKTKEFRIARDKKKIVVAPEWVWMCQDENKRIDELLFPHTHNPKMSLSHSIVITKSGQCTKTKTRTRNNSQEETNQIKEVEETKDDCDTSSGKVELNESVSKQLEEIEALASVSGIERRRSLGRNRSISEKLKHTPTRTVQIETQPVGTEVPESQGTAITWDDPQEREARMK